MATKRAGNSNGSPVNTEQYASRTRRDARQMYRPLLRSTWLSSHHLAMRVRHSGVVPASSPFSRPQCARNIITGSFVPSDISLVWIYPGGSSALTCCNAKGCHQSIYHSWILGVFGGCLYFRNTRGQPPPHAGGTDDPPLSRKHQNRSRA